MNNNKSSLIIIVVIAAFFGITGGIAGELFSRVYLLENLYGVPLFGDINVPENIYRGSNLIIESPRRVIVEQNTKVLETVNSVNRSIVGIFEKKDISVTSTTSANILAEDLLYNLRNPIAQGFVVTSDGWIISSYLPKNVSDMAKIQATSTREKIKSEILSDYVIISKDNSVFEIKDIEISHDDMKTFWKIDSRDLPVRKFELLKDVQRGQLVLATNWNERVWLSSIADKHKKDIQFVMSSDESYSTISLVEGLKPDFGNGFLFNAEGNLLALVEPEKPIKPMDSYFSFLLSLSERKPISKPMLGVHYIDLAYALDEKNLFKASEGALVYSNMPGKPAVKIGSPAEDAGILKNDIIISVNSIKLDKDNNLSDLISQFSPGQTIDMQIMRNEDTISLTAILSTMP